MKPDLKESLSAAREKWRAVRIERLARRDEMMTRGSGIADVRKDRVYKKLKKEQKCHAKTVRHIGKKINRRLSVSRERQE